MSKSTKENNTSYRIKEPFTVLYDKIAQCGAVEYIQDNKKHVLEWDLYSATLYCYLFNKFNYYNETAISQERISADCNISQDTVFRRMKVFNTVGIITVEKGKRAFGGTWKVTKIKDVVNLLDTKLFKLIPNKYRKEYFDRLNKRKEKLSLLKGEVLQKGITQKQAINLYHNRNYELMTGLYLEGDKLNSLLYIKDRENKPIHSFTKSFTAKDELKQYEVKELLGDQVFEPEDLHVPEIIDTCISVDSLEDDIIPF